jgi:hypothetical protein
MRLPSRVRYLAYDGRVRRGVLIGFGALALLGAAWIVVTGLLARQQVRQIEHNLRRVQSLVASGQLDEARHLAHDIVPAARRADLLTSGPAWWLAAHVPYLGAPAETIRGATAAGVDLSADAVPQLIDVAKLMDPARLRLHGDTIDLAALTAAAPKLQAAASTLHAVAHRVDALPHSTWLSAVDGPRSSLAAQLHQFGGYVDAASRAARVLPPMLGADGPRRYFIGLQNEAEARGTGGLPGAFAIAVADHGRVRFTHFEGDAALLPANTNKLIATGLDFGTDYARAYGDSLPTSSFLNSNVSPDFRYAAQVWTRMWQRTSGEHVDGAVAVDPAVLGYVLAVTGPVRLPDGRTVSAQNIVTLTERDEYTLFPGYAERKAFLVAVLKASSQKLISGSGDATSLAKAMVAASAQRRLLVWSADAAVQRELEQTTYAGAVPDTTRAFVGPVLNNTSGGKLDFYLTRTLDYHRSGCGPMRDVQVTLTLANHAPAAGLPRYVSDRLDTTPPGARVGDYSTLLDYYASQGAQLLSVSLNGDPVAAARKSEHGRPIFRLPVELRRGETQTIVLHLMEPSGSGSPLVWLQPGVAPVAVRVFSQACG